MEPTHGQAGILGVPPNPLLKLYFSQRAGECDLAAGAALEIVDYCELALQASSEPQQDLVRRCSLEALKARYGSIVSQLWTAQFSSKRAVPKPVQIAVPEGTPVAAFSWMDRARSYQDSSSLLEPINPHALTRFFRDDRPSASPTEAAPGRLATSRTGTIPIVREETARSVRLPPPTIADQRLTRPSVPKPSEDKQRTVDSIAIPSFNRLTRSENEREQLDMTEDEAPSGRSDFMTGNEKLHHDMLKKGQLPQYQQSSRGRRIGLGRGGAVKRKYVPPTRADEGNELDASLSEDSPLPSFVRKAINADQKSEPVMDERLKNCDPKLVEMIENEVLDRSPEVKWDDIAGLAFAKQCVMEIVVWPLQRPDWFTGLRAPPKGILLFGPPGTGKTLIGKAIASESGATFFSISASSLGSKWHGEGEKLVRTLFAVAAVHQPAIIFIDEIDSLLSQRNDQDFEASRRMKTEFLVRLDGAGTSAADRVLVIGATNRPQELDEAARRRLVKRLYIPLPDDLARSTLISALLKKEKHSLSEPQILDITARTKGYSGADLRALCTEAAYGPVRDLRKAVKGTWSEMDMRAIVHDDFVAALSQVRASVSTSDLQQYQEWNKLYGSFPLDNPDMTK